MSLKSKNIHIETERLLLIPITFQFISKLLNEDITAYEEFGIKPDDEWPNKDTRDIMPVIKEKLSQESAPDGFGAWLFIDKLSNSIVGDGGFKGSPSNKGEIDLGYGVIESKRRQGYAFEAAKALLEWGLQQDNVKAITAKCLKNNTASYNLLRKLGMNEIKQDDEFIYFEINRGRAEIFEFKNFDYLTDGKIDLKIEEKTPSNKEKGYVPAYKYRITLHGSDESIGAIDIRIGYNENTYYGGNIGYSIKKAYRGNNYASKACKIIKSIAIAHGMDKIIITCDPDNQASRKTCEKAGFKLKEIAELPPYNELYKEGKRQACIYELILA